ncbi:hypothetical protein [Sorangium cellulosum]|uniref:Uncharacterized protein n=1 Tax=Sorangium cellulosum TaxID=56 RepID=A0A150QHR0_SORCE|nr:hypothetical protein [Sorangium cellulosum]KYF67296.1 hypothetical protein BE15_22770 [Sorangium cellulosum]
MSNSSTRGRQSTAPHSSTLRAPRTSPTQRREREERGDPGGPRRQAEAPRSALRGIGTSELDEPFADMMDAETAPPLRGKVNPRSELSDVIPTLDDEVRGYHHHPNDAGTTEFEVNPDAADAAADLASDLGAEFLEGATKGQDMSDVAMSHDDDDGDLPYLLEDEEVESVEPDDEGEDELPVTQRMRRHVG